MKRLNLYLINDELWNKFLTYYDNYEGLGSLVKESSYKAFMYGSPDKVHILLDKEKKIICCTALRTIYFDKKSTIKNKFTTYQILLQYDDEHGSDTFVDIQKEFTPKQAKHYINKACKEAGLTKDDIDNRLNKCVRNNFNKQLHDSCITAKYKIEKYSNCYYYDINGAHSYLLGQIIPEIQPQLKYWNAHKKEHKEFKKIPNYYVGILGMKNGKHRKTYNWIVNEVNNMMNKAMDSITDYFNSLYIYINTDGFIIQNPKKQLQTSKELGDFKEEYRGDVYTYAGDNYSIIQYGDTVKGNLPMHLRKYVDLRIGKVVSFNRIKKGTHYEYENIKEIYLNETKN